VSGREAADFSPPLPFRCALFALHFAVMACLAERLERAADELVPVTTMRLDVVDRGRHHHLATPRMATAERFLCQLPRPNRLPHWQRVPRAPRLLMTAAAIVFQIALAFRAHRTGPVRRGHHGHAGVAR